MYRKAPTFLLFTAFAFLTACSSGPDEGKIIGFQAAEDTKVDIYFISEDTYLEVGEHYLEAANDFKRVSTYIVEGEVGPEDVLEEYLTDDEIEGFTEDLNSVDKSWEKYKKSQVIVAQEQLARTKEGFETFHAMRKENAEKLKALKETEAELKKAEKDNDNLRRDSIKQISNVMIKHNEQYNVSSLFDRLSSYLMDPYEALKTVEKSSLTKEDCNLNKYLDSGTRKSNGDTDNSALGFPIFVDGICYKAFDRKRADASGVSQYLFKIKRNKAYSEFDENHKKPILGQVIPIFENYVKNIFLAKIEVTNQKITENKKALKELASLDRGAQDQIRHGYSEYDLRNSEEKLTRAQNAKMDSRFERQNTENVQLKLIKSMVLALHRELYDDFEGDIQHSKVDNDGVFDIPSEDFAIIVKRSPGVIQYETLDLRDQKYEGNETLEIRARDINSRLDRAVVEMSELEYFKNRDEFSSFLALMQIVEKAPFKIKK